VDGVAQFALGDLPQPLVVLAQYEGLATAAEGFAIALEKGIADVFLLQG
jgi:hypothetical protein